MKLGLSVIDWSRIYLNQVIEPFSKSISVFCCCMNLMIIDGGCIVENADYISEHLIGIIPLKYYRRLVACNVPTEFSFSIQVFGLTISSPI